MPVATLTFNLPDEASDHKAALAGVDALVALERIANECRSRIKYGELTPEQRAVYESIREMIPWSLLEILE